MPYSEVRNYGFNIIIKKYAEFPLLLPLPCHMSHGWTALSDPLKSDLKTKKPLMMVINKRRETAWRKKSKIPVVIMGSPFIHYKNAHKIVQRPNASGTIVFPSHSTPYIKSQFSRKEYCKVLKNLPSEFHPITVCLFWLDYIEPEANIYRKMGFKVVTAGPKLAESLSFVKNFYSLLSKHKYATSNEVGSYTFYAVDMGIPFFLSGSAPTLINEKGRDINVAKKYKIEDYFWGKKTSKLFSTGPTKKISPTQRKFVEKEMGMKDCLSPQKMKAIFWRYFKKEHYWLTSFLPYLLITLLIRLIMYVPWILKFIRR